jgi:S-disulfanyl-L-cysteine oxidoreductase SoxD
MGCAPGINSKFGSSETVGRCQRDTNAKGESLAGCAAVLGLPSMLAAFSMASAMWAVSPSEASSPASASVQKQLTSGIAVFREHCVKCHSENLAGGAGPSLRGEDFLNQWDGKTMRALYSRILMTMPLDDPGSLTSQEVLGLVSYIASENSLAKWTKPFASPNELNSITLSKPK